MTFSEAFTVIREDGAKAMRLHTNIIAITR